MLNEGSGAPRNRTPLRIGIKAYKLKIFFIYKRHLPRANPKSKYHISFECICSLPCILYTRNHFCYLPYTLHNFFQLHLNQIYIQYLHSCHSTYILHNLFQLDLRWLPPTITKTSSVRTTIAKSFFI